MVSSAIVVPFIGDFETYVFASSPEGEITDWMELGCSEKGIFDPDLPLVHAGYYVVDSDS